MNTHKHPLLLVSQRDVSVAHRFDCTSVPVGNGFAGCAHAPVAE